ncbi:MAG TPA: carbon storage regulator [Bryobacteraceae bacterium]|nr:carbon storage regulator [Bryobacteraceae bacterium]
MLILRRRAGESITIGDDIEVQVTEIGQNRVKLCISAPKEVSVLRKEVRLTRDANLAAAGAMNQLAQVAGKINRKFSQGSGQSSDMTLRS